ncbi:hypothetical protein [Paenibacillus sp. J22TS3]|uniref:hypothetical protein n=1 Tax=Paenibacillus sp. J22TS3 TaxID=2807192 RepID=UPI001B168154|nr:hypothetical protein [Paenibacillus sp. J22TS3]GIP19778.1 hypothetical protein J22TS3_00530 [Paenibacillus sp. J22TS3]
MSKMVPVVVVIVFFLAGCMTHRAISTEQLDDFKKTVFSEHKDISDLKIQMAPTQIEFNYFLNRKADREADKDVFIKTKALILSPDFQKTVIEESYFKHYSKDNRRYPDIHIRFFGAQKERSDFEYTTSYYGPGVEGEKERPIDGYRTWYFNDLKTKGVPVTQ